MCPSSDATLHGKENLSSYHSKAGREPTRQRLRSTGQTKSGYGGHTVPALSQQNINKLPKENTKQASSFQLLHVLSQRSSVSGGPACEQLPSNHSVC